MGKFMSNRNNTENVDKLIENYNKSMDELKNDFENLNQGIITGYYNESNEIKKNYLHEMDNIKSKFSEETNKLNSKNQIFQKIMPLTETKYKKDVASVESNIELRIDEFNRRVKIQELDQIKETNDKRKKHIDDANNENKVKQLEDKIKKIKEETQSVINEYKQKYQDKIKLLNEEYDLNIQGIRKNK